MKRATRRHRRTQLTDPESIAPSNNKMQQTRSGHSRWRPSLLILVLCRHLEVAAVDLSLPVQRRAERQ